MSDKETGNPSAREEAVYAREDTLPVGSTDKSRAHAGEPDEQYPIPAARPIPWQENPSG
ncbi:hypothetical protein ACI7RC_08360 [Brevibacillus sp. B_LB10_24]|uniref:hypothetical protein n=1 Tax=Brevibacillus sp. B_LB10_24 TaxID=3380645 RepID=UPI0038B76410